MNLLKTLSKATLIGSFLVMANQSIALEDNNAVKVTAAENETADNGAKNSDNAVIKVAKPASVENAQVGDSLYVSDAANVWQRSCASTQCRIVGIAHVGDKLEFVKLSKDKKFALVNNGQKQLWMQTRDLQVEPCGKAKEDELKGQIDDLKNRLENYDSIIAHDYQVAKAKLEKLEKENEQLKETVSKQNTQIEELDSSRRTYADKLETKELDMQMRWWMQGAVIALCGAILGIICVFIPRPNRKKKLNRF
ncbi:MAG: TIGR04211 family SH3 domain-containing protein [Aeromonadales bacterium]|nr:TIGR04211 family SH3 domain-containing protein [Aeromonadales bacterium]